MSSTSSDLENTIMTSEKIIIALAAVCVTLLCVIVFLVVRYRRPRASEPRKEDVDVEMEMAAGIRRQVTPSPLASGNASLYSWEVVETPRVKATTRNDSRVEDGRTNEEMVGPALVERRRSGSRLLSAAWQRTMNLGGHSDVHRPQSAIIRPSSRVDRPKTNPRAMSFPAAFPSTYYPPSPDASLTQQTSNQPLLPNISPTRHRRVHTISGHISPPLPSPSGSVSIPIGPAIAAHPGAVTPVNALPPSPPPSPGHVERELEFGVVGQTSSRPSIAGTHNHSFSTNRASGRQSTIGTAMSSSVPSISTLSGSSGRFSNLFFAPMATSPPQHRIIVEDRDFEPPPEQSLSSRIS
ncbi:hypothetical protein FRB94_008867 [Tulasnella sp. JGI-2019a]|nr:hypothetical protein FRB93_004387 [Tulasnella sp. JGI-2019a]KAG8995671.1 hypothetical protein FRB94_008867 [Tulasnella sp. JGI-2019a]